MNAAGLLLPAPRAVRCLVRVPTAVAPVVLLERDAVLLAVVTCAVGFDRLLRRLGSRYRALSAVRGLVAGAVGPQHPIVALSKHAEPVDVWWVSGLTLGSSRNGDASSYRVEWQ